MQRRVLLIVAAASVAITLAATAYSAGLPALLVVSALVVAIAQQSLP